MTTLTGNYLEWELASLDLEAEEVVSILWTPGIAE